MREQDESMELISEAALAQLAASFEQHDGWYVERCAQHGEPQDHGELKHAVQIVRSWIIQGSFAESSELDATDLPYVWLNAHFPDGLDADRMITALIEWVTWLRERGHFSEQETSRFVCELESTRESFIAWSRAPVPVSASPEGEQVVGAFSWWLQQRRGRPVDLVIVGQAAMTAAINLMDDVNGDPRALDPKLWLERTAYVLMEDAHEPAIRALLDDAVQWFGLCGRITLKERKRMHRAIADAHYALVRTSILQHRSDRFADL